MEIALIGAFLSALGFGIANVVIKKSLNNTSIPQTLLSSMISGSFFLLILVLLKGLTPDINIQLILTLILFAIGEVSLYLSLYKAFESTDVTIASGIINIYPIISTILTIIFLNERVGIIKILFILLMILGAILISIDWSNLKNRKLSLKSFTKGSQWALLCLVLHAIYFPALGNLTSKGNWEFKLLIIKIFAVIILFIIFVVIKKSKFVLTKNKILAGSLLGFLEIIGWIGLSFASNNSKGMIAIIITIGSSSPLITAIGARVLLKEKLHNIQYLGILVVIVGLTLVTLT